MRRRVGFYKGKVVWFDGENYRVFLTCIIRKRLNSVCSAIDRGLYE
jgi:hypothetical protein